MFDMLFEGFQLEQIAVRDGTLRVRHSGQTSAQIGGQSGGNGPPLLLLHGNPQTHMMWHAIAPELAKRFHVICPDLRGYGQSLRPPASADHAAYAKREMARDLAELMTHFGYETFLVVSHDRGARVAHRLALDYSARVERLAVLDIVPTIEHFERTDMSFALGYYHWFWFAQPHPFPEALINAAPELWFDAHVAREPKDKAFFHPEARADYVAAAKDPATIIGMCEDYRAAATIDLVHDRESRAAGQKIRCPVLALWGAKGKVGGWYDPVAIWRQYSAGPVTGGAVDSGHYLAEEAPGDVLRHLTEFLPA
jgi:haloacetate dehalogenase